MLPGDTHTLTTTPTTHPCQHAQYLNDDESNKFGVLVCQTEERAVASEHDHTQVREDSHVPKHLEEIVPRAYEARLIKRGSTTE